MMVEEHQNEQKQWKHPRAQPQSHCKESDNLSHFSPKNTFPLCLSVCRSELIRKYGIIYP